MFDPFFRDDRSSVNGNDVVDISVLLLLAAYILYQLQPSLLFSPTHATGGDTASHYFTLVWLKEKLLPQFRISGWAHASYGGFPLLQFYFPFPFVVMALASFILPMTVAFKLGTIVGVITLPLGAYLCLKNTELRFPIPILAAISTIPFLFMEANSMWGGNIPSTLAGEFAYGWGMSLSLLWLGTVYRGITENRWLPLNAFLLALIGFCHGYTLLFAGTLSLVFLFEREHFARNLVYLLEVYVTAFCLLGSWIVPFLVYAKWTTAFDVVWWFSSWREIFPAILWPSFLVAIPALVLAPRRPVLFIGAAIVLPAVFYLGGTALGLVDIRFLPFSQLSIGLLGAVGLGTLFQKGYGKRLGVFAVLFAALWWAGKNTHFIPSWIRWNYSGFEARPLWPVFSRINERLKGTAQDPRVIYEHAARNEALGTVRAWESLPVFSGRSTLEHAYLQASPSGPFVFYLQSEVSQEHSCPFPDYACTSLDLGAAESHLRLFNVRDYIAISPEAKSQAKKWTQYQRVADEGPYTLYRLNGTFHYVEPVAFEPVLWTGGRWKQASYLWFREPLLAEIPIVFPEQLPKQEWRRFSLQTDSLKSVPRQSMQTAPAVRWEKLSDESIEFETAAVGQPHLIKVSYHPGWKVEGAERIYLVSPAFMLVYPTQAHVRLTYGRRWPDFLGMTMTVLGIAALLLSIRRRKGRALPEIPGTLQPAAYYGCAGLLVVIGLYLFALSYQSRRNNVPALMDRGVKSRDRKDWKEAEISFKKLIASAPLSGPAEHANYLLATTYFLQGKWNLAISQFHVLLDMYPSSNYRAEAYYHIAMCYDNSGRKEERDKAISQLLHQFGNTPWAQYAHQRWPLRVQ